MENKTFDWKRFGNVVNHDIRNLWPSFGPTLLIIVLLPLVVWLGAIVLGDLTTVTIPTTMRMTMIALVISLAGIMAPSRLYRTVNLPKEGIYFAMLPASKLEKYLSILLMVMVVVPILALCGSLVLDTLLTALPFGGYRDWIWNTNWSWDWYNNYINGYSSEDYLLYETFGAYLTPGIMVGSMVLGYIESTSLFLFTSTLFKKHKVLYTILWLYLIEFAITLIALPIFISNMIATDGQWIVNLVNDTDPKTIVSYFYWIGTGINALLAAVFIWWSGHRIKRMRY